MKPVYIASVETKVPVRRSVDQIRGLVERFGSREFTCYYDDANEPIGVAFKIKDPNLDVVLPVRLVAPTATVRARIRTYKANEQAQRVAWRNLHDFVRASLIAVETGILTLGEAFLASVVVTDPKTGTERRFGELVAGGDFLAISPGGGVRALPPSRGVGQ